MLKNTLYLLMACCLLASCEDYDWDTKMIAEGRIVDQNGNPVSNVPVSTYIDADGWFSNADSEIISTTKSDGNGYYRMMFPKPQYHDDILLLINSDKGRNAIDTTLSTIIVYNIKADNFNDYLINFGEQTVFPTANMTTLNIQTFDDPSQNGYITDIAIDGLLQQKIIDYNFDVENPDNQFYFYDTYHVASNQTLSIKYKIRTDGATGPVFTITEVPVQIGTEPVTYTISY